MTGHPEVGTATLRHNPLNAVTATVERVTYADGRTAVRKELRRPTESAGPWAASTDPRHWNYWRRELDVYRDDELRGRLADAGLVLPAAQLDEWPDGALLLMEDISGTPGTQFSLAEHAALARACGRWQARPIDDRPWTSRGFLRDYSTTRDVPWQLMTDDSAWQQPLIRETWPTGLREAWTRLLVHRDALLDLVATLPRAHCHLDFWVSNVIQRPTGELALFDWSFFGDGALGEDIGNYIPDAVFDLFWPAERMPELAETCITNYLDGLHEAGWHGDPDEVRLAVMASGVKYAWLLPGLLGRASDESHSAYHQETDSRHLFHQRGQALAFVADWCAEAITRARR
ncbi:aminoglycoside phosphotransferase [Kribbella sp. NPDC004875]|uniref:aminoglycoside phosphotransferase n=1 Tax=Kribbella sp. NPDC004875 TaxID=3364107 RepID=UPI00368F7A10